MLNIDKLRLIVQALLAVGVLAGGTWLAHDHVITSDAVVGLYGAALGAVGAGAVGGRAAPTASAGTNGNGGSTSTAGG